MKIIRQYSPWQKDGIPCWYSVIEHNGIRNEIKMYQKDIPTEKQLLPIVEKTFIQSEPIESIEPKIKIRLNNKDIEVKNGSIISAPSGKITVDGAIVQEAVISE